MAENLKLPICPKCNETKNVKSIQFKSTKLSYDSAYYSCSTCQIDWNSWSGISDRNKNDNNDCSIHIFENPSPQTRTQYYGWKEYGVGILDQRRFIIKLDKDYNDN